MFIVLCICAQEFKSIKPELLKLRTKDQIFSTGKINKNYLDERNNTASPGKEYKISETKTNFENIFKKLQRISKQEEYQKPQIAVKNRNQYVYITWQFDWDPVYHNCDWKIWSCIWLTHLLKNISKALPNTPISVDERPKKGKSWLSGSNFIEKIRKLEKLDTKPRDKYWWEICTEKILDDRDLDRIWKMI